MTAVGNSFKVTSASLSGSLTLLPCPASVESGEVWLSSTTGFNFSDSATGTAFPVLPNVIIRLPVYASKTGSERQGIYVSGSGTLNAAFVGWTSV